MAEAEHYKRVPYPEHPRRCQGRAQNDQCTIFAQEGSNYCPLHGGPATASAAEKASLRNYQLTKWQAHLQRHAGASGIKSLRDEIGILRMVLETRLETCKDATDLILHSGPISDLVAKIERIVVSCHKLEGAMGQMLDKTAVLQFAGRVIDIVALEVKDEAMMHRIADAIIGALNDPE
jgi:hypothetical protein